MLKVLLLNENAKSPIRTESLSAGYDIYSSTEEVVKAKSKAIISTGIAIGMPQLVLSDGTTLNTVGIIKSRSGLSAKHSLEVGAGVIDISYTSEIKVILYNHSDTDFKVDKHMRVAQLIIYPVLMPDVEIVDELNNGGERGYKGFGSSGLK